MHYVCLSSTNAYKSLGVPGQVWPNQAESSCQMEVQKVWWRVVEASVCYRLWHHAQINAHLYTLPQENNSTWIQTERHTHYNERKNAERRREIEKQLISTLCLTLRVIHKIASLRLIHITPVLKLTSPHHTVQLTNLLHTHKSRQMWTVL